MLKLKWTYGMVSTLLLGVSLAAPAGAECTRPQDPCNINTGGNGDNGNTGATGGKPAAISYDSNFYGFTTGIYGAVNLPFVSEMTDMTIEPALPAGLMFNSSTGGITGTPTTPTEGVTAFLIHGCNSDRSRCASTVIRIAVNPARAIATPAPTSTPGPSPSMTPMPSATPDVSPSATPTHSASPTPVPSATPGQTSAQKSGKARAWGSFLERLRAH